jgi:hypothetical protein
VKFAIAKVHEKLVTDLVRALSQVLDSLWWRLSLSVVGVCTVPAIEIWRMKHPVNFQE